MIGKVFKTASFRVHEPTRKKIVRLTYALEIYHRTFQALLEKCLSDAGFKERCARSSTSKKGVTKTDYPDLQIAKEVRRLFDVPKWPCAPLRDYLISDMAATLGSYFAARKDPSIVTNRPTLRDLEAKPAEQLEADLQALIEAVDSGSFILSEEAQEEVAKLKSSGAPRKALRRFNVLVNRQAVKLVGKVLEKTEAGLPRPIHFEHCEKERGFLIVRKNDRFLVGLRLFGRESRYFTKTKLDGLVDWRTRQALTGTAPILLLPIEFSREFHEREYLENGKPKSAKLIMRRNETGDPEFFVNVSFEFQVEPIETTTILGIDRGWAKIASCSLIGMDRRLIETGIDMEGREFFDQQRRFEREIAEAQRQGKHIGRRFRVRGRAGDNALGEFANRVVAYALEHRSQIVIERLNATAMSRFLRRSQIAKLKSLLDYKTERVGLPKPIEVSAAYSSQTCTQCGYQARENRPKSDEKGKAIQHIFHCGRCGYKANADHNASYFLALRGLHRIESQKAGSQKFSFDDFLEWLG